MAGLWVKKSDGVRWTCKDSTGLEIQKTLAGILIGEAVQKNRVM